VQPDVLVFGMVFLVIGLAKTYKILTIALNRTETKLAIDISFVVVQFQTMHYSTI
jgi:hypothetical protein